MANNRISLSGLRSKLLGSEDRYYTDAAKYFLFSEGIKNLNEEKVLKQKNLFLIAILAFL